MLVILFVFPLHKLLAFNVLNNFQITKLLSKYLPGKNIYINLTINDQQSLMSSYNYLLEAIQVYLRYIIYAVNSNSIHLVVNIIYHYWIHKFSEINGIVDYNGS